MELILGLAIGLAVGGVAAWLVAKARALAAEGLAEELRQQVRKADDAARALQSELDAQRQFKVKAETQLAEATRYYQEQKALLEETRTRLTEAFKALSNDALATNNQAFLQLARQSFDALLAEAKGDVGKRQEAIDALIKPLSSSLERYEAHVKDLEKSRTEAYAALQEHLRNLGITQQQLQKETGNLVSALRMPQVRGRWGELTLHRVVELAGMSAHCDYAEQVSVATEDGALRPDMVIHLPNQRDIVVDSKVSLDAYIRAISAASEEERADGLRQHAQQIRTHMQKLAGKQYWTQFERAPEFVVMFIPGESFFAAALDFDLSLLEDGMQAKVVLATPTTLIALLRAVAYGWRQEQMAENARAVSDLGKELYERLRVLATHVVKLGTALKAANDAYNKTVGSMESRVLPTARKFQELGVQGDEPIAPVEQLDVAPRGLAIEELPPSPPEQA